MKSRSAFFESIGAEFANTRWSWCAVNHDRKEVYFGVWDTNSTASSGTILDNRWGKKNGRVQPGFTDGLKKVDLVINNGYRLMTFQMIQGRLDPSEGPSIIKSIETDLIPAQLLRVADRWIAFFETDEQELVESLPVAVEVRYPEGAKKTVTVSAYERSGAARKACIAHYGAVCSVCSFDFEECYGPIGSGFIHVHHLDPIGGIKEEYVVDPIKDLRPLCPNCHAMVHRTNPPMPLEDLSLILNRGSTP